MSAEGFDQCPPGAPSPSPPPPPPPPLSSSSSSMLNCVAACDEHRPPSSCVYDLSAACVMSTGAAVLPSARETDRVDDVPNQPPNDHFLKTKTDQCDNDNNCIDGGDGGGGGEKIQTEMNHVLWMRSYYHRNTR